MSFMENMVGVASTNVEWIFSSCLCVSLIVRCFFWHVVGLSPVKEYPKRIIKSEQSYMLGVSTVNDPTSTDANSNMSDSSSVSFIT